MAEAKHSFVDDNPYLVYSPNAEITYDGNSGGIGFPVVEITDTETGALSVTAGELTEMLENSPVIANNDSRINALWEFISAYQINEGTYIFYSFGITPDPNDPFLLVSRAATSEDDYPIYND